MYINEMKFHCLNHPEFSKGMNVGCVNLRTAEFKQDQDKEACKTETFLSVILTAFV